MYFSFNSFILSAIVYVLARAASVNNHACFDLAQESTSVDGTFDIAAYREKLLAQSKPYIIECAEADGGGSQVCTRFFRLLFNTSVDACDLQEVCHLPREKRYAALNQKGITLWMTGLSGSGKSTIATLLEAYYFLFSILLY